jgi:hypothetical protein
MRSFWQRKNIYGKSLYMSQYTFHRT